MLASPTAKDKPKLCKCSCKNTRHSNHGQALRRHAILLRVLAYSRAAYFAERIEQELRVLNAWRSEPLPESAYNSEQAFFADTMTFYQWLQFVLLARIRQIIAEKGKFPVQSQVGTYAVRELDGLDEASDLISVLAEFDQFIEGLQVSPEPVVPAIEDVRPVQPPPVPTGPPLAVAERYWQTRDPMLLHSQPRSRPGYDVQLAERVFNTATALVELVGEPAEISDGLIVRTVLHADRGSWLVLTVLRLENRQWRVDLNLSLGHTAMMFLRQHHIHPPYTETNDARGRAIQFWQHVSTRNERWARELLTDPAVAIPEFGDCETDEFVWYLDHTESAGAATVRVLMNTHRQCRVIFTRMVERGGAWFVDLAATLVISR